ncbi:MAG: SufD family Fe-S cluster assembly protein [Rikenellaceae bacterium]
MSSYPANYLVVNLSEEIKQIDVAQSTSLILEGEGSVVVNLSDGAKAEIVDLSTSGSVEINMAALSSAKVVSIKLSSGVTNYKVSQNGKEANIDIYGATIASENKNIEMYANINHNSPYGQSSQLIKSIGAGESSTKFEGRIFIEYGASSISAMQQNKNLLLSSSARISSNPWLEIYNDDVKCSHGSTTGVLDEDEIFYMRQRGISLNVARALQIEGFVVDISNHISDESLRELIHDKVVSVINEL